MPWDLAGGTSNQPSSKGTVTPSDFFATPPVQNAQASVDAPVSLGTGATLPVVGGTGEYAGASGVVTMVAAADGSTTDPSFNFSTK
jgi:hypothetical protein